MSTTPWTDTRLRRAYYLAVRRGLIREPEQEDPNLLPLTLIPRRSTVKEAKRASKAMTRARQPDCMLNMPAPARHKPVPYLAGEREKRLFAAHDKRRAAGWLHG